jgi:signal transduction histidine kinase
MTAAAPEAASSSLQWPLPCMGCASDRAQPAAELAALERMQKAQAESMRLLVHELRSPVAASKSMVSTLRYLNQEDAQFDDLLVRIENRQDQLLKLVTDILHLSQAKSGHPMGKLSFWTS